MVKPSDLAGWAEYGYYASHGRFFWGLSLHLICTPHGLAVAFALTGAKAIEREVQHDIFATEPELLRAQPGQSLLADRNYYGREFEHQLAEQDVRLLRPARESEALRTGSHLLKQLRQLIESVNDTLKRQFDLQRVLALTAAIWHNDQIGTTDSPH